MPHSSSPTGRSVSPPPPIGAARYRWRSAPEPTDERVALDVRSGGSRVHSPSSSFRLHTNRRISGSTCVGYSSRSQPLFVMWRGVWARPAERVKHHRSVRGGEPRSRRSPGRVVTAAARRSLSRYGAAWSGRERGDPVGSGCRGRTQRNSGLAAPDIADTQGPSRTVRTARTRSPCPTRCGEHAGSCRRARPTGSWSRGGEGGIRTHEVFRLSAFQERRHQPLGHLSGGKDIASPRLGWAGVMDESVSANTAEAGPRSRPCRPGGPSSRVDACRRRSR